MSGDSVNGKGDFLTAFNQIYDYAGKPPAKDVMALYDSGEVPPEKPELHPLKGFIDFYRGSVARAWFEEALTLDRNRYPDMFLRFVSREHYSPDMLPFFATFLDAYLGAGHGVKVKIEEGDSKHVMFISNDRDRLIKIAEGMSAKVWERDPELRRKIEFFLASHHSGSKEAFKWHVFLSVMNDLGVRLPEA